MTTTMDLDIAQKKILGEVAMVLSSSSLLSLNQSLEKDQAGDLSHRTLARETQVGSIYGTLSLTDG